MALRDATGGGEKGALVNRKSREPFGQLIEKRAKVLIHKGHAGEGGKSSGGVGSLMNGAHTRGYGSKITMERSGGTGWKGIEGGGV